LAFLPQTIGGAIGLGAKIYLLNKADDLLLEYGNEKEAEAKAIKMPQMHEVNSTIALNDISLDDWIIR
jgi:hypothetical protein